MSGCADATLETPPNCTAGKTTVHVLGWTYMRIVHRRTGEAPSVRKPYLSRASILAFSTRKGQRVGR